MNANHMSGPWVASDYSSVVGSLISKGNHHIAAVLPQSVPEEAIVNARMIAAAPDLLKACQGLLGWYEDTHGLDFCECDNSADYTCRACQARAAIAKAISDPEDYGHWRKL